MKSLRLLFDIFIKTNYILYFRPTIQGIWMITDIQGVQNKSFETFAALVHNTSVFKIKGKRSFYRVLVKF